MNRQPKSKLDLVLSNLSKHVTDVLDKQSRNMTNMQITKTFNTGDKVLARNYNDTELWLPGEIVEVA